MGRTPNYRRDRQKLRSWRELESRVMRNENLIIPFGRGKYPKCLTERLYDWCPKKSIDDYKNVPKECKLCPQFTQSKLGRELTMGEKLKRIKEAGLPTIIETKY